MPEPLGCALHHLDRAGSIEVGGKPETIARTSEYVYSALYEDLYMTIPAGIYDLE